MRKCSFCAQRIDYDKEPACVAKCPSGALTLRRKPDSEQPSVPKDTLGTYINVGRARGKMGIGELASIAAKSQVDRLLSGKS